MVSLQLRHLDSKAVEPRVRDRTKLGRRGNGMSSRTISAGRGRPKPCRVVLARLQNFRLHHQAVNAASVNAPERKASISIEMSFRRLVKILGADQPSLEWSQKRHACRNGQRQR